MSDDWVGEQLDDPNRQAVGLEPVWVEGTGGPEGEPAPAPQTTVDEQQTEQAVDLDSMTKAELLDHARQIGASPANNDMTKDELRAAIDEAGA